jgi:hypothetical protein
VVHAQLRKDLKIHNWLLCRDQVAWLSHFFSLFFVFISVLLLYQVLFNLHIWLHLNSKTLVFLFISIN